MKRALGLWLFFFSALSAAAWVGWVAAALAVAGSSSCSLLGRAPGEPVDLAALADDVEASRQFFLSFAPRATPATQEKIARLSGEVLGVEAALLRAAEGGPVGDVKTAALAALAVADQVVEELRADGKDAGDLWFWLGVARGGIAALARGDPGAAARAVEAAREEEKARAAEAQGQG